MFVSTKNILASCEETLSSVEIPCGTKLVQVGFNEYTVEFKIVGTNTIVQIARKRVSEKIGDYANYFAPVDGLKQIEEEEEVEA